MTADLLDRIDNLVSLGRAAEAIRVTEPLATAANPSHAALAGHSVVLKALRRTPEALAFDEQATKLYPSSGVAWHNLAATLADLGEGYAARNAAEEALRRGLTETPATWRLYARTLLAVGDLDVAERAYQEALGRAGSDVDLASEYANIIWMRRGDMAAAQAVLDRGFQNGGSPSLLLLAKAKLFEAGDDAAMAARLLAMGVERLPGDIPVLLAAAQAAVDVGDIGTAERFVRTALGAAPDAPSVLNQAVIVELAAGRADHALLIARRGLELQPGDQSLWGWAATAARVVGDPLYRDLYDYDAVVRSYELETPPGWASLEAYLADLAKVLRRMHPFTQHPFHQSLRHGSQTMQPLATSSDPVLQAFFAAMDKPIREHMAHLGQGADALRRRNTGNYLIDGAWSVSLKPGGFHKDHFHPQGWLSSAFYVETPDQALETDDKQGWIRFGQPPIKTDPALPPEHYVRPQPGRLVLFPSYMWHGTEPFTTDERRMTIAFDVIPA